MTSSHSLLARGFALAALLGAPAVAQGLPPLIPGFDADTVALGQFENGELGLLGPGGSKLVKTTGSSQVPGIYGSSGMALPLSGVVSIHESAGFDARQGTLEMWVRVPGNTTDRRHLFTLEGVNTLNGDAYNDLFVGQAVNGDPAWSEIRFGTPDGPSETDVALIKTFMPRGVSAGDVDGDGHHDLVISQNQVDEIHVFRGPLRPGFVYDTPVDPDRRIPVLVPQGHALADLDGDGDLDLLVSSYDAETVPVFGFENDGTGRFTPLVFKLQNLSAFAEGMAVGHVDDDDILDVVFGSLDTAVPSAVFLGRLTNGKYSIGFNDPSLFSARSASALGVCMADVDEDGAVDVLLARTFNDEVAVHLNRGDGTFLPVASYTIPCERPFTVTASEDVDNDGHLDVVVAQWKDDASSTTESVIFRGPDFTDTLAFDVQDAVSMTLGDLDGNGAFDLFWRSSTALVSPLYELDVDGNVVGSSLIDTLPTTPGTAGPGMGVFASIGGGTSPYTTVLDRSNSFDLFIEDNALTFAITDRVGRRHTVSTPFLNGGPTQQGWRFIQAEWSTVSGRMALQVLPDQGSGSFVETLGEPFSVTTVHPWMRLGSDPDNQRPCRSCRFDDVRVSRVQRSLQ